MEKEIEHLIHSDEVDSVVLYRLPYKSELEVIIGKSEELIYGVNEQVIARKGFVFEPFDNVQTKGVFISESYSYSYSYLESGLKSILSSIYITTQENNYFDSAYDVYSQQFDRMHHAILDNDLDKVILSRTMRGPSLSGIKVIEFFEELTKRYPHAFVYAINTPTSGLWIGAGPELLLKNDGKQMETVSLAGTLPNTKEWAWSNKELEEQQLVTEYVEDVLLKHQVDDIQEYGPDTIDAGQVKHLCTSFSFESALVNGNHLGLLYELHPTPAVCGMPKEEAHRLILDTEKHDRNFYSGFLGPVGDRQYEFYVNIRCLEVFKESSTLFIGGGLTKDSEVKKEWDETELKAETLLSVLKNI